MSHRFRSDGLQLVGQLAEPEYVIASGAPALVICHGFPSVSTGRVGGGSAYYDLAQRLAAEMGWIALAFAFRGCGESEGEFSLGGWLSDVNNAVAHLNQRPDVDGVWVVGFGSGGAIAIAAAAVNEFVCGVAALGPPADFNDWADDPESLLAYARAMGAITDPEFPQDMDSWVAEFSSIKSVDAAETMSNRPLLVMHGSEDDLVPVFDARVIADAHGAADLRIISGAGHRLLFDPRAIAVLLGWLDRVTGHATAQPDYPPELPEVQLES